MNNLQAFPTWSNFSTFARAAISVYHIFSPWTLPFPQKMPFTEWNIFNKYVLKDSLLIIILGIRKDCNRSIAVTYNIFLFPWVLCFFCPFVHYGIAFCDLLFFFFKYSDLNDGNWSLKSYKNMHLLISKQYLRMKCPGLDCVWSCWHRDFQAHRQYLIPTVTG